jgi:MT0933-like antitoxin protein
MGLLDKLKEMFGGRKEQIKDTIDRGADAVEKRVPEHADKVEDVAEKAKDAVDKID